MKYIRLDIPDIDINKVYDDNFNIIYYDLFLNGNYEGRYQSISDIHWRIGLILSEQALSAEVE